MFTVRLCSALVVWLLSAAVVAVEISVTCGNIGKEQKLCREGVARWEENTGHKAKVVTTSLAPSEHLAMYQQMLGAGASDIDVLLVDVIWPGILGNHLIDLKPFSRGEEKQHLSTIIENNTYKDRLVAMPWFCSIGLMYYRKDLLDKYHHAVPETWEELAATALAVQKAEMAAGNSRMRGYVFQAKASEGLTCNALEWIYSYGGGQFVNQAGEVTVNNSLAIKAIQTVASWIGKITPEGILNYMEEDARAVFQSGHAVFMRNWPYAWALSQGEDSPVKGKVEVMAIPKGGTDGRSTSTLGGWQLAVSKYSRHPDVAASLVMWLTSREEQKRRALEGSANPTMIELYSDPDVLRVNPFMGHLKYSINHAVARPSRPTGASYNKVSSAVSSFIHNALSGVTDTEAALAGLEKKLVRLKRNGW